MDDMICVGTISGAFGVHGEVRIKSFTADPQAIADYTPLRSQDGSHVFDSVQITRSLKNGFAARMSGVASKEEADGLSGTQLFVSRDTLPNLPDDEYYHTDLMGLEVVDTGGNPLGTVHAVHNHGATDLLELQVPGQSKTVLLPFTLAAVPTVDLTAGRIVADPPDGLFD
ncbi:MAG: ribosome maturation factor RimM [Pelagimonas sp.]|uniref:ribosome maturation factor RimM n=1 Tax=Pelagimonas sp. TaxID=2073170 RepID=UPI003D6AABAC